MMHFLEMGGYGAFVWPAYGVTVLGLGGAGLLTLRAYFRAKTMFAKLGDRNPE
ncbi:MAG TPA: heme exporter protein CcmD [Rhizomicrobium sp.]|jgi:heme exporter protein CcmD|nr:heme exporter protein CcmD [Rhizomicrobium sp.]